MQLVLTIVAWDQSCSAFARPFPPAGITLPRKRGSQHVIVAETIWVPKSSFGSSLNGILKPFPSGSMSLITNLSTAAHPTHIRYTSYVFNQTNQSM